MSVSTGKLKALLSSMAQSIKNVFIVIDALDECIDTRPEVLDTLKDLHVSPTSNIRVLYTSRKEIDIKEALSEFVQVLIAAQSSDLKLYVTSEIQTRT